MVACTAAAKAALAALKDNRQHVAGELGCREEVIDLHFRYSSTSSAWAYSASRDAVDGSLNISATHHAQVLALSGNDILQCTLTHALTIDPVICAGDLERHTYERAAMREHFAALSCSQ